MNQTHIEMMARASGNLPLPQGGALSFAAVGPYREFNLPECIRRCSPSRRATFASGRVAARDALNKAGYRGYPVLDIGADKLPTWPPGWLGSISHSNVIAAALVAPENCVRFLGLDIERLVTTEVTSEIASDVIPELLTGNFWHPSEFDIIRAFSAKESLYKALFPLTRQFREFSAAHIGWNSDHTGELDRVTLTLTEDWAVDWPSGTVFEAIQAVAGLHVITVLWG